MPLPAFRFKKFSVEQHGAAQPVGTDAVLLGAWADVAGANRFLDIGTGTGVIALMLAQRIDCTGDFSRRDAHNLSALADKSADVWSGVGVEIHPPSAALAQGNFSASPWAERLEVWKGSVQNFVGGFESQTSDELPESFIPKESGLGSWSPAQPRFDVIVSNPPFFSELTISPDKDRCLGRHTATLSPGDLLKSVCNLLAPNGRFCVVLPPREAYRLCELAVPLGLYWTRITEVRSRPGKPIERLLLQFEKDPYAFQRATICLYREKAGEGYSAEFQRLTKDFYLE